VCAWPIAPYSSLPILNGYGYMSLLRASSIRPEPLSVVVLVLEARIENTSDVKEGSLHEFLVPV
jgi:hypothetical protein